MGSQESGAQAEEHAVVKYIPRYSYPGQWADDLASMSMMLGDAHAVGTDIAMSSMDRNSQNELASMMMNQTLAPYQ